MSLSINICFSHFFVFTLYDYFVVSMYFLILDSSMLQVFFWGLYFGRVSLDMWNKRVKFWNCHFAYHDVMKIFITISIELQFLWHPDILGHDPCVVFLLFGTHLNSTEHLLALFQMVKELSELVFDSFSTSISVKDKFLTWFEFLAYPHMYRKAQKVVLPFDLSHHIEILFVNIIDVFHPFSFFCIEVLLP